MSVFSSCTTLSVRAGSQNVFLYILYKNVVRSNMSGSMDVLDVQCLATNDSISGFTISGFSSCKFNRNIITIRRKKRLLVAFPSSERGKERPEDSGRHQEEQQILQPHRNCHTLVQVQSAPMDLSLPMQLEPGTAKFRELRVRFLVF